MTVLRDIFRRRLRSLLTVSGIAVGVFALVVLGAMAEKANVTLETSGEYYADKVTVVEEKSANALGYSNGNRPLTLAKIEELRDVEGVLDVAPQIALVLDESKIPIGVPPLVVGGFLGTDRCEESWEVSKGRIFAEDETGVALVGVDLLEQMDAELGGTIEARGAEFEVVGLLDKSYTMMDQAIMVPIADARQLYVDSLPKAFAEGVVPEELALQATAYIAPGFDADDVARRVNDVVNGVKATGPTELKRQLGQIVAIFNVILVGVGSLALIVGGLSIINTMTVSVAERTRELGVKRALGASKWRVAGDVLAEAAVTGALGGALGVIGGAVIALLINAATSANTGIALFSVTGRLAFGAVAFSVLLGTLAGAYPAWYAARMDPVDALAYE